MTDGGNSDIQHAALASRVRRHVLDLLASSAEPLNATTIAARVGLHVTTIRFHLDQLESAKLIRRHIDREGHRGRPPVVYVADAAARGREANHQLAQVLADALSTDSDGGRTRGIRAGVTWGNSLSGTFAAPDADAGEQLVRVLDGLGFDPNPDTGTSGDTIRLMSCPFRDIAISHPDVICSVHLGLLQSTVANAGHTTDEVSLDPLVEPSVCVVKLHGALIGT